MNNGKLFLTSSGLSTDNLVRKFEELVKKNKNEAVAIVTTAADGKANNKYSQLAKKQLEDIGFSKIDFVDLETEQGQDFSLCKIIYVCGGNTFKLLKYARQANFKSSIEFLLHRDGCYVGVSAGSIIIGPSIDIANEINPDSNEVGLTDLTGLKITNLVILPHYDSKMEKETKIFETKHGVSVERLADSQALLVAGSNKILIK